MTDPAAQDRSADDERAAMVAALLAVDDYRGSDEQRAGRSALNLTFRSRLTIGLVAAAIIPLASFGLVVLMLIGENAGPIGAIGRVLLFAVIMASLLGILLGYLLTADLMAPLRAIASAVDRVSAGDLSTPILVPGDDELAHLADSHNRLASTLERRNRELGGILAAIESASPRDGVEFLAGRASADARVVFGMVDCWILLVDAGQVPPEPRIPGEPLPIRSTLRAGEEDLGVMVGHLPATRVWERADQDLFELYASEVAVAIRNAELFARVEAQNNQLIELDAAKDDFLRGVSHNLQSPLTSIRAYADQLNGDQPDRRLGIIAEQAERLSRMVRQLLTVTRLESGALHPRGEVVSLGTRVRRAWEALGAADVPFEIDDRSGGWLAIADTDQLDQVLWAMLDNAVKYGNRTPVRVELAAEGEARRIRMTIADGGPGVPEADRGRLFGRFVRGATSAPEGGSGLGLYVSRELCRAMEGDLVLEPRSAEGGAAFSIYLPGEPAGEG